MAREQETEALSAFNEGMYQIQRLNFLWTQANNDSRLADNLRWRWTLDAIWRELSRDAIMDVKGSLEADSFDKLDEDNPWFKKQVELDKEITKALRSPRQLYQAIGRYEIFLRSLQDAVGKGGKRSDPNEDDVD